MADTIEDTVNNEPELQDSEEPRHEDIAVAAYYIGERRGFKGDLHVEDWLEAEASLGAREVDGGARDELSAREHVEEDIKPDEIDRWAHKFHVSKEQLRTAIQRVGPNSTNVKQFLRAG